MTSPMTMNEAAAIKGVTKQALSVAIRRGRLKAEKKGSRWTITREALADYYSTLYNRCHSVFDGDPLFDNDSGFFSVNQIAKKYNLPAQAVYYSVRKGLLPTTRKGCAWVIHIDAAEKYFSRDYRCVHK